MLPILLFPIRMLGRTIGGRLDGSSDDKRGVEFRFEIDPDDKSRIDAMFEELIRRGKDMTPLMQEIGEHLSETTKQRFQSSTSPSGAAWAPNAPATYLRYLGAFKDSFGSSGKITKSGASRASGKKPLIGETRRLSTEILYSADSDSVEVGSYLAYSAIHQFGGTAGRGSQIPARPYIGISSEDAEFIEERAGEYLRFE